MAVTWYSDEDVLLISSGLSEKIYNLKEKCKDIERHVDLNQPSHNVNLSDFDQDIDPSLHHYNNNTECHYYIENNFNKTFMNANNQHGLSIFHLNCRSLPPHFDEVMHLLQSVACKFKVIALSETWLITVKHRLS